MRVELKAYGRGKSASIYKSVGEVRMRADSTADADCLKSISEVLQRPALLSVILELSDAILEKRVELVDRKLLAEIIERASKRKRKAGE